MYFIDYSKGFGGKYGVSKDSQDKVNKIIKSFKYILIRKQCYARDCLFLPVFCIGF